MFQTRTRQDFSTYIHASSLQPAAFCMYLIIEYNQPGSKIKTQAAPCARKIAFDE